ncbi:calcium-binding EGF-like domain-containing protein [Sorangium sp. So ce296]|uniref:EGF-like domain-containing protein n=1 Tax=Sorangium cellulosum TaxID=56 RepID=A0A4P2QTG6_SORCE|nr:MULTISPECIES: calcium-binding EGF-like domain-containing protein [Sorangium]AUX33647.1 uncharacterized protein SOCE836_058080 [Sorangium cellulosum]WCQ92958.1 hypothetical protein NQZ70_05704 [Sorangium sp. Soce836]
MRYLAGSLLHALTIPALSTLLLAGCTSAGPSAADGDENGDAVGGGHDALTPEQCTYFDPGGTVQICHHTGSATKPYTILRISDKACINAHSAHDGDYITSTDPSSPLYDPTCNGQGCLPVNAPCDATLPCCDGLLCQNGTCTDPCASAPCQNGGACAATESGYTCTCAPGWTGTNCETNIDECAPSPCVHGTCNDEVDGYTCTCAPGFSGTNCETNIDDCASGPCVHGACNDQVNGYTCTCAPGWTGTTCETAVCVPTTCDAQGATCGSIADGCDGTLDCGSCGSGFTCQSGTCQPTGPTGPACPCDGMPGWGPPAPPVRCINYSGFMGPGSIYYYLKSDANGHEGPFVEFAVNGQFGPEPDQCGYVSVANTLTTMPLTSQAQADLCVQSFLSFAGSCP